MKCLLEMVTLFGCVATAVAAVAVALWHLNTELRCQLNSIHFKRYGLLRFHNFPLLYQQILFRVKLSYFMEMGAEIVSPLSVGTVEHNLK